MGSLSVIPAQIAGPFTWTLHNTADVVLNQEHLTFISIDVD